MATAKAFGDRGSSKKGPIPLLVGVTGHRDIPPDAVSHLKNASRRVLASLMRMNRHTRIIVLSPLSEGADRIVAECALDLGLEVVCPLAMPEHAFKKDFENSVDDFYRLFGQTTRHFIVPCRTLDPDRERRYEALAVYIAQASDVLIALWDEKPSERIGGTAKTVHFKLHGVPKPYDPDRNALDLPDTGPVYHIVTPRITEKNGRVPPDRVFTHHVYWPAGSSRSKYGKIFKKIDDFNGFAAKQGCAELQSIDEFCFSVTDEHAQRLRIRTDVIRFAVFFSVLLSFVSFELYRERHWQAAFIAYFACLAIAVAIVWCTQQFEVEKSYLDYRALAEACRVQSFWHRLHLHEDVADHYLHKQRGQVQWIRKALRSLCTFVDVYRTDIGPEPVTAETIRALKKEWVEKELRFFNHHMHIDNRRHKRSRYAAYAFVAGSAAVAFLSAFFPDSGLLSFSAGLAVMAALVHGFAENCAWSQHSREYSRMRTVYANANSTLKDFLKNDKADTQDAIKLFRDLGNEALAENGDWFLVHRERPIEVPDS